MRNRRSHIIIGTLTLLLALGVINFLASRHHGKIDLTERNQYTLAPATEVILKDLPDVVTIRVYFSRDLPPALIALKRSIDDLLDEFRGGSAGKVHVEYIDPAPNRIDEQRTISMGIAPVQLNVIEHDRRELVKVYLGMVIMHEGRTEVFPVVQSTINLEYRLAKAILKIMTEKPLKLGWWGGRDDVPNEVGGGFGVLLGLLEERYSLVLISEKDLDKIGVEEFETFVIASPGKLSDDALSAIDGYLAAGGKVVALVDRWNVSDKLTATLKDTNVPEFLAKHGVTIGKDLVIDRSNAMASFTGSLMTYHLPYPFWPQVRPEGLSEESPITAELSTMVLPWTSSLEGGVALVGSTDHAKLVTSDTPDINPETASRLLLEKKGASSYSLVDTLETPKLMVVGSSWFAQDNFLRRFAGNIAFIENAVDAFAVGDKLIGIRSRLGINRPVEFLSDGAMLALRTANMLIGPIIVVLIGVVVFTVRRWRRNAVRRTYA